jgi:menaquinol-cytochrome c reductase iron-sulfur subunit
MDQNPNDANDGKVPKIPGTESTPDYTDKHATPDPTPHTPPDPEHRRRNDAAHPASEMVPPPTVDEQEQRLERERVTRRTFLMNVGIALNAAVAALVAIPVLGYVLGPVTRRKQYLSWVDIGPASQFQVGQTTLVSFINPYTTVLDGETAKIPAYVRATAPGQYVVFAVNCAHLGCPVRWFSESQLFMCPCHGGVYYADGSRASGPPERGLFTYPLKVENGRILIDAGQMPTLSTQAKLQKPGTPCPGAQPAEPALVTRIEPCNSSKSNNSTTLST